MSIEMSGQATTHISASPQDLYDLVSDVTRMGEWSPECQGADWADGSSKAEVGAQFHGRNKTGTNEWVTPNTILVADPGREFTWVVGMADFIVTRWRFVFEPAGDGTQVTESFELGKEDIGFRATVMEQPEAERPAMIEARRTQLVAGMEHTLERLKECAEGA